MKKKTLIIITMLCLISLFLFSCNDQPCTEHTDADGDGLCDVCGVTVEAPKAEGIGLIKDGVASFNIVIRENSPSSVTMKIEQKLVVVLSDVGIDVQIVADKSETATECEILVGGAVSRGEKYDVDQHYLGAKGYAVKAVDNKVLILFGSLETLDDAITHFVKEVLGISGRTESLTDVIMTTDMNVEEIQDDYAITSVSLAGASLSEYVIAVSNNTKERAVATSVQNLIYANTGIWLKITSPDDALQKAIIIRTVDDGGADGFSVREDGGKLYIECEFPEKFSDAALTFVRTAITSKKGDVKLQSGFSYTANVRNIYYKDFGAKGDGKTDDFYAIKATHDYANKHGHTVCAESGKTYYIGNAPIKNMTAGKPSESRSEYITIMTDVNWEGAKFIFDDSKIPVEYWYKKHLYKGSDVLYSDLNATSESDATCSRCHKLIFEDKGGCTYRSTGWHSLPIFLIKSDSAAKVLTNLTDEAKNDNLEWEPLSKTDTYLKLKGGEIWKPDKPVIVLIKSDNVRHYIRTGTNVDNGQAQQEIIIVNTDGTIDESTPLHWDYESITYVKIKPIDDTPITVSGGNGCTITTVVNRGPNYYYPYGRNIVVQRSNATISGITHLIEGEDIATGKCPQNGFTYTEFASNVEFKNMIFSHQKGHKDASNGSSLGTYEMSLLYSTNVTFDTCSQTDFYKRFKADGSGVLFGGFFGSDYCKNLSILNSELESFDAHCGAYNVTLKNSTFEHINCVGEGLIYLEDVTVFVGGEDTNNRNYGLIRLRTDYGSTWRGELYAKNVKLMSCEKDTKKVSLFHAEWKNHDYGYTTYFPEKVTLDNVKVIKYSYTISGTTVNITEKTTNAQPLYLANPLDQYKSVDISSDGSMGAYKNDRKKCACQTFYDPDGDGRCNNKVDTTSNAGNVVWCWGYEDEPDTSLNANPYVPTKTVIITNCEGLTLSVPPTPQFKDITVTVDGGETTIDPETGIVSKKNS